MTINPEKDVFLWKSIFLNTYDPDNNTPLGKTGQIRYNNVSSKFEGYHNGSGVLFGNPWRPLTQDIATSSNLGIVKIGNNLLINPTTGLLSSIATGKSRIYQHVITVSPIVGTADYSTINGAITDAIGTAAGNYLDGSITSINGSAPSPTYPYIIQISPGQYTETSNQIILPDYVSLRGEDNYNCVITQNTGNATTYTGSMIVVGQNSEVANLVIKLADNASSISSTAIYSLNKSNVVIDNCIFTCNANINTTGTTNNIYMDGGLYNSITNCKILTNAPNLTGNYNGMNISNTTPRIINNNIDILTPLASYTTGIALSQWNNIESILDKTYIENLTLSNNYKNTIASSATHTGIKLNNSPVIIRNSDIEVANDPTLTTNNYGIAFQSATPLITTIPSSNVISFINISNQTNYTITNTIHSSNTAIANFFSLGFQRGQYIAITGSSSNDSIYRIADVENIASTSNIILDTQYQVINENASLANTITIKALYYTDIQNSRLIASTKAIENTDTNSNYIFNLQNVVNNVDSITTYNISPSHSYFTNYKTITVGKANCDFNSLYSAMNSISVNDTSYNSRYLIKIESGIYQEPGYITCKPYVNIEGNGETNTKLLFYQADLSHGTPTSNSSCILMASNMSITNLTITNSNTLFTSNSTTTSILHNIEPITNFLLENIVIDSTCSSAYNYGMYLESTTNNIVLRNVDIIVNTNNNTYTSNVNIGIYNNNCIDTKYYNVSSTTTNAHSLKNYAISMLDSNAEIYNSTLITTSATYENMCIKTENVNAQQKLIQIYNGQIRADNSIDYSIYADDYHTIICNAVQLLGDTHTSSTSSRIFCCGCYTFNDINDKFSVHSLNSRGQDEQSKYGTITIGDTAGKLNASGIDDVIIGYNAGSNITTASYNTFVGAHTGENITSSTHNTLLGSHAGQTITSGSYNTITGSNAGISITTGSSNIINGYNSGKSLTTGNNNTFVGTNSGQTMTTGNLNVFIGTSAGLYSATSNTNTFVGASSGTQNQSGNDNTYIGYQSGHENISGSENVLMGIQTGYNNQSNSIVAIGNQAGYNNNNSINNTYLGTSSGYNNTTGDCNTYLGNHAGYSTASASGAFNTAIGNEAGYSLTSGSRNILIGSTSSSNGTSNDSAGWSLTSGNDNVQIGVGAGSISTSATNNIILGSNVGSTITNASNNVLIGKNTGTALNTIGQSVIIGTAAGNVNTAGNALMIGYQAGSAYTGAEAFAIGYQAGTNVSGDFNMFMGYNSGGLPKVNTTGANNLAIGPYTGFNLSSGARNVLIGGGDSLESVGRQISTGSDNTLIGYKSGKAIQTGIGNTLIGSNAGANLTSGTDNLILGYQSAFRLNSGSYNVVLGPESGYNMTIGTGNIYNGYQAGYNNTSGAYNINMGYQSGYSSIVNSNNIHIGYQSGYESMADNNLFIGYQSGYKNTYGTNNIFIGKESGAGANANNEQIGKNNIFIGTKSGTANDNGYSNIFMGSNTGASSLSGAKNIFIGENAGSSGTTSHNIFIGSASSNGAGIGYLADGAGQYNVFIGTDVGIANTSGADNIFIGDKAGKNNVDGLQNIYIGTNAGRDANSALADNNIAIGSDAGIHNQAGKENILIGKQVAGLTTIGNSYNNNIILGTSAGQHINQDNQIFVGTNAGNANTTGDRNIFIGLNTGYANITSCDNVIIGSDAGVSMTGQGLIGDNVIIGSQSGHDLTSGTNNIYIGSSSGASATTSINNVVIGANAMLSGNANNLVIIGKNAGQSNEADASIFIGSNAGVQNTTGIGNIFVGYEAGYAVSNSNGNIIFGNQASSTGRIADNNIILGNQTASNVVNKANFANNIVMGADAGKNTNLAISSIMIGSNSVGLGTGGDVNIIMGNNTAVHLGDQHNYYATTLTQMTFVSNNNTNSNVTIDIPFGTGSHYFNYGDSIIIESLNNEYVFQTQVSAIIIDGNNSGNNGKTELILRDKPTQTIPSGSVLYVKTVKQPEIGPTDYSKSSSNMCIGDQSGYDLTTGSKNAAIGDSAMYQNKIGRYNIAFGTEAGYSLNTDNNLCLGIKAGYSLDSYKDTSIVNDFIFYQSTNTITSNSQDFTVYPYGTQFEINGSSSNDARYNVNNTSTNSIIVQGYPNIIENGLPLNPSTLNFVLGNSQLFYINYSVTATIQFLSGMIVINYNNFTQALNAYNTIQNSTHFIISGSKYNNGIKLVNYYQISGYTSSITLNYPYITILTIQNNYPETTNNVTLAINNIAISNTLTSDLSFNNNIFSSDSIYVQYGNKRGKYILNNSQPYYFDNISYFNIHTTYLINGAIVSPELQISTNSNDLVNKLYIQGFDTSINIKNVILSLDTKPWAGNHYTLFNIADNTIQIAADGTGAYFVNPFFGPSCAPYVVNSLIQIIGSQYNDGYYYITNYTGPGNITSTRRGWVLYIDPNYPIKQQEENTSSNVIMKRVAINNNTFDSSYESNSDFKGNIIKVKYNNSIYKNYVFGTYILENYYKGWFAMNDNLLKFNGYPKTFTGSITPPLYTTLESITYDFKFSDTGFKTITNNYISSSDLIFQTSNIAFSNVASNFSIYNSNNTITTNVDYEFVHIVAPVIIKIEGSNNNNNGFYLVTSNPRPFKTLYIDSTSILYNELNTSNITLKTNCISSYLGNINLSNISIGQNYKIYGSKYNDDNTVSIYNGVNTITSKSIYLSDSSIIVNDTCNDYCYSLTNSLSLNSNIGITTNIGYFQNFTINATTTVNNSTTISFLFTIPYTDGRTIIPNQYLKLTGTTPTNNYDGLYCVSSVTTITGGYQISFLQTYQDKNGNIQTGTPFTGASFTSCNMISNQFIFNGSFDINGSTITFPARNLDWNTIITGFGENAKFMNFTCRDGTVTDFGQRIRSTIFGSVSNNSLTFEIESYNLNLSNIAVSLVETCPAQPYYVDIDNYGYVYTHFCSFIIDFGVPNPSTRVSNIYRTRNRPIIYSSSIINFENPQQYAPFSTNRDGATYTFNASSNSITASNFTSSSNSNNLIYGKLFSKDNFAMFYPGQIIYSFEQFKHLLIKSISTDLNTIYLDSTFSTVSNGSQIGAKFNLQNTIYDASLNFKNINPSYFNSNYVITFFRTPISTSFSVNSDILSADLYFKVNQISYSLPSSSISSVFVNTLVNQNLQEFCMNNTLLIPTNNIIINYTKLSFHNLTVIGSSDIKFYSSNNTITSTSTNLSSFLTSEYILVSGTTNNNYLYRINDTIAPTSNKIIISTEYALVNEINVSATLKANNINSSNILTTDLSVFGKKQILIVSHTKYNNTSYTTNINSNSQYSIYIDSSNVITETPEYCNIEKSILNDETSIFEFDDYYDISFNNLQINSISSDLSVFRTGQKLAITGTTYNNNSNVIISNSIIPSNISITTNNTFVTESISYAILKKQIDFTVIGEPILSQITNSQYELYHYKDAEGNNSMIGSFAGQFVGALHNAIYNVAIGSRCGQVNHGSGNIFIGNESQLANNATEGATTYDNKFAIYKTNTLGIQTQPLIGGDFGTGRVGINTINPESFTLYTDITSTDMKLVVNGGAIANSFSPFTGCHLVNFDNSNISSNISIADNTSNTNITSNTSNTTITTSNVSVENYVIPGMIMSSVGIISKPSIINTFLTVKPSSTLNDKKVFGVYAYSEESKASTESEYIIDSNGKYVKNLGYNNEMVKLNYVASIGEGCILVSNYSGEIQNGDYITTCPIAGYGALQSDDFLHSYTVAKCTEDIDWSSISDSINHEGQMYKYYLAGCTYHCG